MKKKIILILLTLASIAALAIWIVWGNSAIMINEFTIVSEEIPDAFSGYRIAQVSDLHNAQFGDNNEKLLELLRAAEPDVIVLTGDLIDSRNTDIDVAIDFAREASSIALTYYVTGNHESRIDQFSELISGLRKAGVIYLNNRRVLLNQSGARIILAGIDDPNFFYRSEDQMSNTLASLSNPSAYTVLLSHRPELFDLYAACEFDLVLSGHAHGGQIRIPLLGGLIAPNQGLFPQYDSGLYSSDGTNMIVSRGLGNSLFPVRINNRPEIIVAELQSA